MLPTIGIDNIPLIVIIRSRKRTKVLFFGFFLILGLFTNLVLGNKLLKKNYYLYYNNQTINY